MPRPLLAVVALIALLAGALAPGTAHAAAPPAPGWRVTAEPFAITVTDGGRPVVAETGGALAAPGGRLVYQVGGPDTGTNPVYHRLTNLLGSRTVPGGTAYTVATDEPGRTATVTLTHAAQGVKVAWTLSDASGVTAMLEALTAGPAEHYLGGSSAAFVDLRGHVRGWSPGKEGNEAGDDCQNQEQTASPFYLSSGGYGLLADTSHVGRFAFPGASPVADGPTCANTPHPPTGAADPQPCPLAATAFTDRVQVCVKSGELAYEVFAGTPNQVTTAYYRTVGPPSLPPPSEFALMKWRDVNSGQAQVLDDVAQLRRAGIPVGTIWIDNPWERQPPGNTSRINGSACTNSGEFDPTFFPDPQRMIDEIHAQGVRFGLWVTSHVGTPSASQGGGSCAGINDVWSKNGWLIPGTNYIDFTVPAARRHYVDQLTRLFRMGVDMVKEDRGEEFRLETARLAAGSGSGLYLRYPDLYHEAVTEALRAADGADFETLVRAGGPGTAQHTHGMWGSDTFQTFAGLRTEVRYGTSESLTGHFAWGSDTGGIDPQPPANASNSPTPSLFTRWSQFSAVSPVFEVGGAGLNATPWAYDAGTVRRFRDAVTLHYELFPYLYGLAREAARTGVPILRALGQQYPADQAAWAQDQEFMVGPDLLAAPVTADRAEADGAAGRPTPVDVYLPAGRWVDVFTGEVLDGGRTVTRTAGLDEFPLFLRAGAAIGFNARGPNVWPDGWAPGDLTKPGLAGWLYAPGTPSSPGQVTQAGSGSPGPQAQAGSGSAGPDAQAGAGTLTAATSAGRIHLTLTGAPARAQVVVLTRQLPRTVTVDGVPLPHAADTAALRGLPRGWTVTPGAFGGVVLKLTPGHETVADLTF